MVKFLKSNLFFFVLLFLVVFVVYGKAINFGLTNLDDDTLTQRNLKHISNLKQKTIMRKVRLSEGKAMLASALPSISKLEP